MKFVEEAVPEERGSASDARQGDSSPIAQANDPDKRHSTSSHKTPKKRGSLLETIGLVPVRSDDVVVSKSFSYKQTALPDDVKAILSKLDRDGDGNLDSNELVACIDAHEAMYTQVHFMRKLLFMMMIIVLVLGAVVFGTVIAGIELTKEARVEAGGVMTASNGQVVKTASNDLAVCADGSMVPAGGTCGVDASGRRLQGGAQSTALSTVPLRQQVSLSSSLSDTFFMALDEVAVFSDKGHSLRLGVHGFARIPVNHSRCGNIVHLYTAWNGRLTLDSTDLSFDAATEAAFRNAGFSLIVGGVSGRRLSAAHSIEGFFLCCARCRFGDMDVPGRSTAGVPRVLPLQVHSLPRMRCGGRHRKNHGSVRLQVWWSCCWCHEAIPGASIGDYVQNGKDSG